MTLSFVASIDPPGSVPYLGSIAQMAMHPNGKQAFVASYEVGIVRFDFSINPSTGAASLTNPVLIWQNPVSDLGIRGSLGLSFHQDPLLGTVLYLNQAVPFVPGHQSSVTAETGQLQS